jgi:SAM-dependent methyltransferase
MFFLLFCFLGLCPIGPSRPSQEAGTAARESPLVVLERESRAIAPLVNSRLAKDFLSGVSNLPSIAPRTVYLEEAKKTYLSDAAAKKLDQEKRAKLKRVDLDESYYWNTKYGSPLAYARPLDLLGRSGLESLSGKKVLDFGYGTIGHLRLLAAQGALVTGVDVDPLLPALYSESGDQGVVKNQQRPDGQIRLVSGRFPADAVIETAVAGDYDLIISKNTLKNGYVHPEQAVDVRRLLNLGAPDATFVTSLHQALKPGGRVLIYNICPAPSRPGEPYKNWADGRCPFAKAAWTTAGFEVLAFDHDDSEAARALGHALGWDLGSSAIDLKDDLFAMYSLLEKPKAK